MNFRFLGLPLLLGILLPTSSSPGAEPHAGMLRSPDISRDHIVLFLCQ